MLGTNPTIFIQAFLFGCKVQFKKPFQILPTRGKDVSRASKKLLRRQREFTSASQETRVGKTGDNSGQEAKSTSAENQANTSHIASSERSKGHQLGISQPRGISNTMAEKFLAEVTVTKVLSLGIIK